MEQGNADDLEETRADLAWFLDAVAIGFVDFPVTRKLPVAVVVLFPRTCSVL